MPFARNSFEKALEELGHPIPVYDVLATGTSGGWRIMVLNRLYCDLFKWYVLFNPLVWYLRWIWYFLSRWIKYQGRSLASHMETSRPGHDTILILLLKLLVLADRDALWGAFWWLYFLLGDTYAFQQNYLEAWKQKIKQEIGSPSSQEFSLIMFLDNEDMIEIPCLSTMDDNSLIQNIRRFYYLKKAQRGLFGALGLKSLDFIEVGKLERGFAIGDAKTRLPLGRYRAGNRLVYFFRNTSELQGNDIVQNLIRRCALTEPGHQRTALNLVHTWNAELTSHIIAVPFVGSFLISVIWPIVARRKYHADIQTSIQTGFTIGSYVVTAGGLLIALIAFLDTRYENSKENSIVEETQESELQDMQGTNRPNNTQLNNNQPGR